MTVSVVPTYSLKERDRRWDLARNFMDREGLDALLVFGEHEDAGSAPFYFDTWFTNDRPGATVLVPRTGDLISLASFGTDHTEAFEGGDTAWIAPENVRVGREAVAIVDVLNESGLANRTIGVVGLDRYNPWHPEGIVPYTLWSAVQAQLPDTQFRPVGAAFARLTAPLSQEEIAVVRHSADIGDAMVRAMVDAAGPGVPENEVYAAGMAAAHARGTVVPVMLLASGPAPMGGGPPPWAYRPQAPRILRVADVLRAEVFCMFGMRATQHQVTMAIGKVDDDFERAAVVARESYDVGLRALRPKRTFGEVVDEMRKPVEAAGGLLPRPLIHTMNPFGSRGGGMPTTNGDMQLEAGMTFALEPHCAFGRRKVTIGGTVIVGNDGPIELNPYTAQLLRVQTTPAHPQP